MSSFENDPPRIQRRGDVGGHPRHLPNDAYTEAGEDQSTPQRHHETAKLIDFPSDCARRLPVEPNFISTREMVGNSARMRAVSERLVVAARSDLPVLITGATGTGKEVVTDLIHQNSQRAGKPLIKVACCALSPTLVESEIFGHVKGAFTGAQRNRAGRFEMADGGTIYLDDIDDTPLEVQAKLLRVIETNMFERVGGNNVLRVDVRIIASTKKDLLQLALAGGFRTDLYYRLSVIPIHLPPLASRAEDIPLLVEHFIDRANRECTIEADALQELVNRCWPGNVRQLKNCVDLLLASCLGTTITADLVQQWLPTEASDGTLLTEPTISGAGLIKQLEAFEKTLLTEALICAQNNKHKAAELLAVPASTLKSKLKKYGL